ncbi:MAG: intradiol ring-cleavage dioxygenase [Porticoccaceae bacterium]|jgi:hydroxyquinol 1,2-dioxygenase
MSDLNETTITEAVLASLRNSKTPRARQIGEALVRHLHAFIREVRPSEAEWEAGIRFLTDTGQKCDDKRQEYILLSDTLGVSTLVDSINHPSQPRVTETTVFGPFYVPPPEFSNGDDIRGNLEGTPLYICGTVRSPSGAPIADAVVDVWHSDEAGFYDVQQLDKTGGLAARGRFRTGPDGSFQLWTVKPSPYPIPTDGPVGDMLRAQGRHPYRPEHVHFMIQAPGYQKLVTHVFASGDQYLGSDAVFGVKSSLIREFVLHRDDTAPDGRTLPGEWFELRYDFGLQPA